MANIDPNAFFHQSGPVVAGVLLGGWLLGAVGLGRAYRILAPRAAGPVRGMTDQLVGGILAAWPAWWLFLYFALVDRDFGWSAIVVMLPTLLILPAVLAGLRGRRGPFALPLLPTVFLGLVMLALCGTGIGLDRDFSRLDGHFILTLLLLYLWADRETRTEAADPPVVLAAPDVPAGAVVLALLLYHLGAVVLLVGSCMAAATYEVSGGVVLGVLLSAAWSLSLSRRVAAADSAADYLIVTLPLALVFLLGPLVLLTGGANYPITVWQMEAITGLLLALLWLGLSMTREPLSLLEIAFLLVLYLLYLGVRIYKLF